MATGVLVLGVERATRLLTFLVGVDKVYDATIRLGSATVTDDAQGDLLSRVDASGLDPTALAQGVLRLTGAIEQVPSAVSAVKVDGRRAYARVRAGEAVDLAARPVTVRRFVVRAVRPVRIEDLTQVDVEVTVECTSGTYIRALARDLGESLGVGGHLTALRRTRVGTYGLDVARTLESLTEDFATVPMDSAARAAFPARELTDEEVTRLGYGQALEPIPGPGSESGSGGASGSGRPIAAFAPDGGLVAIVTDRGHQTRALVVLRPKYGRSPDPED
jgi:tRNA pseudouridine55 synthase